MNIGAAASQSGVSTKTIRYYESVGLIPAADRCDNGYRRYAATDIATLRFIQRARHLGFSVAEVRDLLALWQDRNRASADVKALALGHIASIEARVAELQTLQKTLIDLTQRCHGDDRPDCPILNDLAGD